MSAQGPESIPTSADPRSKRPVKKRALTPVSAQAATVDALFAKPEQEIRIPASSIPASQRARVAAPPEIVTNVQGSSAGAGSGEFHVYKASRRREYERLRLMDEELKEEQAKTEFEKDKLEQAARDEEKTRKNREKREKKKKAKDKAKKSKGLPGGNTAAPTVGAKQEKISTTRIKPSVHHKDYVDVNVDVDKEGQGEGDEPVAEASTATALEAEGLVIQDDD
ncbi:hypothetical protein MKZ38_006332 [Zalerion maritima]|uniref:DUF1168-domain-containing protein n=1 Tax=Zalerion maritima TaxID=339359 RepID=A0AAD5RP03_9PEZI|nr:hypothetical protein MKZ38_006332 [Zalerion maritima]